VQARIGLGTAALTVPYGAPGAERPPVDPRAARRTLALALDAGLDFIDTAPAYGDAEALVGEIAGARECRIATKLAIPSGGWQSLDDGALRAAVDASVDRSRRALRRERIDVLQIHNATPELLARATLIERSTARPRAWRPSRRSTSSRSRSAPSTAARSGACCPRPWRPGSRSSSARRCCAASSARLDGG
jgi:aryl-alcohol dehydrogenase-like predicted oxidoreductase